MVLLTSRVITISILNNSAGSRPPRLGVVFMLIWFVFATDLLGMEPLLWSVILARVFIKFKTEIELLLDTSFRSYLASLISPVLVRDLCPLAGLVALSARSDSHGLSAGLRVPWVPSSSLA